MYKKQFLFKFLFFLFFIVTLCFPRNVFEGASDGLLLWFHTVLPTLFPVMILSDLLISTGTISFVSAIVNPFFSKIFHTSPSGSFAVLTGFLCGYPMGAKIVSDLTTTQHISKNEAQYLLSICNNTSPGFVLNFVVLHALQKQSLTFPTLIILTLAPFFVSLFTRKIHHIPHPPKHAIENQPSLSSISETSEKLSFFSCLEHALSISSESLIKVGGYIMIFSIILSLCSSFFRHTCSIHLLLPFLEITNGIDIFAVSNLPFFYQYICILSLISFGGFCSIAQTNSMIIPAQLSIKTYTIEKLAVAITASLLGTIYLIFIC